MRRLVILAVLAAALVLAPAAQALPPIKHVFVLMLENEGYNDSFGHPEKAPFLARQLPSEGELLPNYYGIGHESLDNYIALVSGQSPNADTQADCQVYTDFQPGTAGPNGQALGQGCVYPAAVDTIAGQLAARGLTWHGYMEDMGTPCRHPASGSRDSTQSARVGDQYAARHNPFVYFHSLIDGQSCQANDVPLSRLQSDLTSASTTPAYSFITPNLCHDGHDSPCVDGEPGGLTSADAFLREWVPFILSSPGYRDGGLLMVTFDEANSGVKGSDSSSCCGEPVGPNTADNGGPAPGPGGGQVGAVLVSPYVRPGSVDTTPYNHYALLRTVEDLFGLGHLGYAGLAGLRAFGDDVFNRTPPPGAVGQPGGGASGSAARILIQLTGVPRGCVRRDFRVRVLVGAPQRARTKVKLDRRIVVSTLRSHFSVRVPASRLGRGRHQMWVRAVDGAGQHRRVAVRFRRC